MFILIRLCGVLLYSCVGMAYAAAPLRLLAIEYPPYAWQDKTGAKGVSVDVVKEAFGRMKQPVDIAFYPWARAVRMVETGMADGMFTIKKTPERERVMLFPKKPVLTQDYVFFVMKDSFFRFDGDMASLARARIGVVYSTSYGPRFDTAVKNLQIQNLDYADNYKQAFKKLLADRVDAVICSRLVGWEMLRQLNAMSMVNVSGPLSDTALSYLVFSTRKDYRSTAESFDQALDAMNRDGTVKRILQRYAIH